MKYKIRYAIGGHRDSIKSYLVHGSQTLQESSARLLLALAPMFRFNVWSSVVKSAYLQSSELLMHRVFIKDPEPEFEVETEESFELLRPLYGLADAGDLWHKTLRQHLTTDIDLEPTKAGPSLYFSFRKGEIVGINGSYVDDLLREGDFEFQEKCSIGDKKFETSGDEPLPFAFAGSIYSVHPMNHFRLIRHSI